MAGENDLIKLYSGRILALAADIPNSDRLEAPAVTVKKRSPLCGSTVTVDVEVDPQLRPCLPPMKKENRNGIVCVI